MAHTIRTPGSHHAGQTAIHPAPATDASLGDWLGRGITYRLPMVESALLNETAHLPTVLDHVRELGAGSVWLKVEPTAEPPRDVIALAHACGLRVVVELVQRSLTSPADPTNPKPPAGGPPAKVRDTGADALALAGPDGELAVAPANADSAADASAPGFTSNPTPAPTAMRIVDLLAGTDVGGATASRGLRQTISSLLAGTSPLWLLGESPSGGRAQPDGTEHWVRDLPGAAALLALALPGGVLIDHGVELGPAPAVDDGSGASQAASQRPPMSGTWLVPHARADGRDVSGYPQQTLPWQARRPGLFEQRVAQQGANVDSTLSLFRDALRLRALMAPPAGSAIGWLPAPDRVLAFDRGPGWRCIVNLGRVPFPLVGLGWPMLMSSPLVAGGLAPYSAAWLAPDLDLG